MLYFIRSIIPIDFFLVLPLKAHETAKTFSHSIDFSLNPPANFTSANFLILLINEIKTFKFLHGKNT